MNVRPFQDLYTAEELRALCEDVLGHCVSAMTIRRWGDSGRLPCVRGEDGVRRFPLGALAHLIIELKYIRPMSIGRTNPKVMRSAIS